MSSSVSLCLGATRWSDEGCFRAKVDGCVPHTRMVNLRIVRQATGLDGLCDTELGELAVWGEGVRTEGSEGTMLGMGWR